MSEVPRFESKPRSSLEDTKIESKIQQESVESDTISKLRVKMGSLSEQPGLAQSLGFINSLPKEEQAKILELFSDKNKEDKLAIYIDDNGFPNSETYAKFKGEFKLGDNIVNDRVSEKQIGVDTDKKTLDTNEKNKKAIEELGKLSSKIHAYQNDIRIPSNFLESLDKAINGDAVEFENVKKEILGNNEVLEKILKAFLEIDRKNAAQGKPTQLFKEIAANFSSFDPSLNARIEKFKLENSVETLQTAQINATLGTNSNKQYAGDFVYNKDRVAVDLSKNPPEAFMSSEGGYKLPLDMPVREFYPATVKYEKARQNLEPQITTLNSAGPVLQKAYEDMKGAESQGDKNAVLSNVKLQLKGKLGNVYDDLNLDSKTSIKDIVDIIRAKRDALQKELTQAYTDYQTDLKRISETYAKSQQEKKDTMKSSLALLSSIGFDSLPQHITDQILSEVNQSTELKLQLGIRGEINIAEGKFGIPEDNDSKSTSPQEKQVMVKLLNKIISGTPDKPLNVEVYMNGGQDEEHLAKNLRESFRRYNQTDELWGIETIRANLRKQPVSDTKKNPS